MKTRPGASMCAGVKQGVNEMLTYAVSAERSVSANPQFRPAYLSRRVTLRYAAPYGDDGGLQLEMLLIWLTV